MSDFSVSTAARQHSVALWVKRLSGLLILIGVIGLIRALPVHRGIQAVLTWVEGLGPIGPVVFALVYVLITVLFLPGSPFSIAAGALFGLAQGIVTVFIGATLGAGAAFLIGRYAAREWIERRLQRYPRFKAVDRAVAQGSWKIVALLRLSPAIPFNLQNYLYGLTAIRFWPCLLASAVAMLPGILLYVYIGYATRTGLAAAASGEIQRGTGSWLLLGAGLIATIVVTIYITRLARRALQDQTDLEGDTSLAAESSDTPETYSVARSERSPWVGATGLAFLALVTLSLAVSAQLKADWLTQWLGPPAVTMQEAYSAKPSSTGFDHGRLDRILEQHVNANGGIDYQALAKNPEPLEKYNRSLASAPFDRMGRDEKLALLINAYNSFTLELILEWLDRGIDSIKDIPAENRWRDARWQIGDHTWSLNQIEHEQIRPKFREPDIHWALVCAAVGCPPLRREAYVAERIDQQLDAQARRVHTDGTRWLKYEPENNTLRLTPLYKWYANDFEQVAGSVIAYAARYSPELKAALEKGSRPTIQWLNYNWALNSQENLP